MKFRATITIIAEYDTDWKACGFKNKASVLTHDKIKLVNNPISLLDLPNSKVKVEIEEVK